MASTGEFFTGLVMDMAYVNLVWRIILGSVIVLMVASALIAWSLYGRAVEEVPLPPSHVVRTKFSIDELRNIVNVYQKKEEAHAAVLASRPPAPKFNSDEPAALGDN